MVEYRSVIGSYRGIMKASGRTLSSPYRRGMYLLNYLFLKVNQVNEIFINFNSILFLLSLNKHNNMYITRLHYVSMTPKKIPNS